MPRDGSGDSGYPIVRLATLMAVRSHEPRLPALAGARSRHAEAASPPRARPAAQVNASHEDYIALRGEPRTRLRYLLALFAKEVAYRAHGVPGSEAALESLVEILAHAERNLSGVG